MPNKVEQNQICQQTTSPTDQIQKNLEYQKNDSLNG